MTHKTKEELIAFENRIRDIFAEGELPFLIHLDGGNEEQLIRIFNEVKPGDWILGSHRSHYLWLLAGGSEDLLESEIRAGRSMFLFNKELNFLTSSILAGTCGIAAGLALSLKMEGSTAKVWCFLGDGAADEGAFYEAANFVEGHDLPCMFIIGNNNRSVETTCEQRRGPHLKANLWKDFLHVIEYHYTSTWPHGGAGLPPGSVKFKPEAIARYLKENP